MKLLNFQNKQIKSIISEIDEVLNQTSTENSPKVLEKTLRKSQKILKQVLKYLSQNVDTTSSLQLLSVDPPSEPENIIDLTTKQHPQQVEEFLTPINHYLQEDFQVLKQQRQALQEEIRQLEKQRQDNYSLAQQYAKQEQIISEFSQALIGPVQEALVEHLSQLTGQHPYPSQSHSALPLKQNLGPQTSKNIESSEMVTDSEDKLREDSNFGRSFIDDFNTEDSEEIQQEPENFIASNVSSQNIHNKQLSPQINELAESSSDSVVLPYPGYEFVAKVNTESETTEIDNSKAQELSIQNKLNLDEQQDLEVMKNQSQQNKTFAQLEAPSFEENDAEWQKSQNLTDAERENIIESPLNSGSELDESENVESTEIIESLSNLFGELEMNEAESNQLITSLESKQEQTSFSNTSEKEEYIQASSKESLLPIQESDEKQDIELLLDTNTLNNLRSDLENLEEFDLDELADDPQQTTFQLGEYSPVSLAESHLESTDDSVTSTSEEKMTNLEDLFTDIGDVSEKLNLTDQENTKNSAENTENEQTLEDILDGLTSSTEIESTDTDEREFVSLETLLQDPPETEKKNFNSSKETDITPEKITSIWYLGIDFGNTDISAALFNLSTNEIYPIYWEKLTTRQQLDIPEINQEFTLSKKIDKTTFNSTQKIYHLPSTLYIHQKLSKDKTVEEKPLLLQNFKPALKVTIPYVSIKFEKQKLQEKPEKSFLLASNFVATTSHEPVLQLSEHQQISLKLVKQGLVTLLTTLQPQAFVQNSISLTDRETQTVVTLPNDYTCGAVGLDRKTFVSAFAQLKCVLMGSPTNWPEAYRFNLREAVLEAGLVKDVSQVIVIEDAIATALSELTSLTEEPKTSTISEFRRGKILIVNVGATTTEMALVNFPDDGQNLTYSHFHCHSFAYGGHALDQDIICQLLLKNENISSQTEKEKNKEQSTQLWPRPGYPDLSIRYQLQQWLESSSYRQELLAAARNLKVILPSENEFTLNIGDRQWNLQQQDLEKKVLEPFIQQLNQELNNFLSKVGISPVGINRALCTGGSGSWSGISRWLRQKLPNAIIVQDAKVNSENVELGQEKSQGSHNCLSEIEDIKLTIGRVAYGLAILPLYPQIIDIPQQQYNDYFLLWEILRVFPDYPLSVKEVYQLLEEQGINTRVCQEKIKTILDSKLPPGLMPSEEDVMLLSEVSRQNSDYQNLRAKPLFYQETDGSRYCLSDEQAEYVREYLNKLVASTGQKFEEPLLKSLEQK